MRALITNNGTHSPEDWAVATAEILTPLAVNIDQGRKLEALKLRAAIAEALIPHHGKVHSDVRASLTEKGDEHFAAMGGSAESNVDHYIDDAVASIQAAASGTPWEANFSDAATVEEIRTIIARHFRTHIDVEMQHHADKHPNQPNAQAYKAFRHPAPAANLEA